LRVAHVILCACRFPCDCKIYFIYIWSTCAKLTRTWMTQESVQHWTVCLVLWSH